VAACLDPAAPKVADLSADLAARAHTIAEALLAAERPLIVSGVEAGEESVVQAAANVAAALRACGRPVALMLNVPECNSLGLALMTEGQPGFAGALAAPAALVIVLENDLSRRAADVAFGAARLVVLDHSDSPTTQRADLVLPVASFAESGGTLVSSEGRAQRYYPAIYAENEAWRWLGTHTQEELLAALAQALPCFAALPQAAPPESFRVAGCRIASQPHRFSGRTAMYADRNVREPRPPVSADSPFSATMEGYYGKMPAAVLPFSWAPGWNSAQSINKFQAEIGGAMAGGDAGVRLLETRPDATLPYYTNIPAAFALRPGAWRVVTLPRVFGDDEQSARAAPIRARTAPPVLALNDEDAASLGAVPGDKIACGLDGALPLEIHPELPRGIVGLPATAAALPAWIRLTKAEPGAP